VNTERTQALGLDASLALMKDVLKADRYEVSLRHFGDTGQCSADLSCLPFGRASSGSGNDVVW
jgi:hypothetical protein